MRDVARACLTRVAGASTSSSSSRASPWRLARGRLSTDADVVARRLRDDVRAGKRPEFVDVASHVLGDGARFSRARAKRGWDWHAWQLFVALTPAMMSYACVTHIHREYGPVFEEAMEKRERGRAEEIRRATEAEAETREADARALAERVATLEARVRGVESSVEATEKSVKAAEAVAGKRAQVSATSATSATSSKKKAE